jgi:hypothetical protein
MNHGSGELRGATIADAANGTLTTVPALPAGEKVRISVPRGNRFTITVFDGDKPKDIMGSPSFYEATKSDPSVFQRRRRGRQRMLKM